MKKSHTFARIIATGFGVGYIPWGPGSFGTALGVFIYVILFMLTGPWMLWERLIGLVIWILLFLYGGYCCTVAGKYLGKADHGAIVWDEMVAIWLVMLLAPDLSTFLVMGLWDLAFLAHVPFFSELNKLQLSYVLVWLLAFLFFRLFDIVKPFPANHIDKKWHHGFGVMFDDIIAAGYTLLLLWGLSWME